MMSASRATNRQLVATSNPPVSEARRRTMKAVGSINTSPELTVRRLLHRLGYRYRLHVADLPGRPDIVFPARRKIIEVRGCFWHGHTCLRGARTPLTRALYWSTKIARNRERDLRNTQSLRTTGWEVLDVWECEIRREKLASELVAFLGAPRNQD